MTDSKKTGVDGSFEFKFARDLIRYVLNTRMTGLNWAPIDVFTQKDLDSPFTPQMKETVRKHLDECENYYHYKYDKNFKEKVITIETHIEFCTEIKTDFLKGEFTLEDFVKVSVTFAKYAGLSYLYGVKYAPHESCKLIIYTVRDLKEFGKIDDNFWNELQDWVGENELMNDESENMWESDYSTETASESETNVL